MVARVVDDLLAAPDGHGRLGRDFAGTGQGRSDRGLGRFVDRVDQAVVGGFLSAHAPACVSQFLDYAQRHELGQALQAAQVGRHADIDFLHTEKCLAAGVAYAGRGYQIEPAAHAAALYGADHGHAQGFELVEG